jgi:dihydroxyacetone kinase
MRISRDVFRNALLIASDCMCRARDELCALDAAAGDGDLGVTLAVGFTCVRETLSVVGDENVGAMLTQVGGTLARAAPSTIGALLATAFMRAGRQLNGVSELEAADVAAMLRAAAAGVAERGGVTTGQRTVLDAMDASAVAAESALERGLGPIETLREAAAGARAGAEATAMMEPQVGRAAWIRDRAFGRLDGGAVAWATFVNGLADGIAPDASTGRPAARQSGGA